MIQGRLHEAREVATDALLPSVHLLGPLRLLGYLPLPALRWLEPARLLVVEVEDPCPLRPNESPQNPIFCIPC
jgi:hypothetical protein